jgi:hypothetical protein
MGCTRRAAARPLGLLMTGILGPIVIYVPRDFKGVVSRRGDLSGASISGSAAAHHLAGVRLNQHAYRGEDEVIIHSTSTVRVCVMGEDPIAYHVPAQSTRTRNDIGLPSGSRPTRHDLVCCFLEIL